MGLDILKMVVWIVVIIGGLVFGLGSALGLVKFEDDHYQCYRVGKTSRYWYAAVPKQTLFSIGKLHLLYQPMTYGCQEDYRFDPTKYRAEGGNLVPIDQ